MTLHANAYHSDDPYTDPMLVQLMILLGKSPFWEVQLALGEFENNRGTGGARVGSATPSLYIDPNVGGVILQGGCPTLDQYVWLKKPVQAYRLPEFVGKRVVWNPLTKTYKKLLHACAVKDVPLFYTATESNIVNRVSRTHKILRDKLDLRGFSLSRHDMGRRVLTENGRERLIKKEKAGRGDVMKLEVEDHIYVTGDSDDRGTVAHNLKDPDDID